MENNTVIHELRLKERSLLNLNGVSKIISFDSKEFLLESNMGTIHISGENLELLNLDTTDGNIRIKGKINGFNYIESNKHKKEESILSKLFK